METNRSNSGWWILGSVVAICATILICTGHEVIVYKAAATAAIICFFIFMCAML